MKKYLLIYKPQCGIYQVDINLYNSEEEGEYLPSRTLSYLLMNQ